MNTNTDNPIDGMLYRNYHIDGCSILSIKFVQTVEPKLLFQALLSCFEILMLVDRLLQYVCKSVFHRSEQGTRYYLSNHCRLSCEHWWLDELYQLFGASQCHICNCFVDSDTVRPPYRHFKPVWIIITSSDCRAEQSHISIHCLSR